ncbi:sigma-54-dependent transcriptional regulator [Desulfosarcina ovata]|uniref:Fis family transcriptional regulator n=1 Tax=Desulfosarcina ovata subsp. ovata TaxID=2752305 RepID=A0A5K8AF85_9BACT|nr:sigma-54 dependent transcriptional regulator [Desulfosarcina ovata]BBO91247.1 Fis family transcriptional regulator [Desulfosarcina ovata subsp. ovata]
MARILVVDDDVLIQKSFSRLFTAMGHDVRLAGSLAVAERQARDGVDVVYLDLDLPDGSGVRAIDAFSAVRGRPEVIVITGMGSLYGAERTLQSNVWDYITKPASPQLIRETLQGVLQYRKESRRATAEAVSRFDRCGIVGTGPSMRQMLHQLEKAARSDASVLVSGETGVGKEVTARAIHANSCRRSAPFVVVDCSNMTDTLIESMLYGHSRGAFTGAHVQRKGLVAEADGGTLFLDEVGELSPSLQKSFLRVLQERRYRPVGAIHEHASDFRLVAATNRDLGKMAAEGTFRSDLLFRIRTVEIVVPPLRDRGDDRQQLAEHFIDRFCDRYGLGGKTLTDELTTVIDGYRWPGNVRELSGAMEAAVINAGESPTIYPKHLPASVRFSFLHARHAPHDPGRGQVSRPAAGGPPPQQEIVSYQEHKRNQDRIYFSQLMEALDYDIATASQVSGLSVPTIYRYLSLTGIPTRKGRH